METQTGFAEAGKPSLSAVVIPLMKGVLYQEDDPGLWDQLLKQSALVREYVAVLGLDLQVDETEGYAFLRSLPDSEDGEKSLPRLVVRRPLSYPVSLVLALLREKLLEFDANGGAGTTRLILSRDEVADMIRVFLPEGSNEAKLVDQVDVLLNKIADLGFVRRLRGQPQSIEVRRILKAFVDAQWLDEFDRRLAEYREHALPGEETNG